MATGSTKFKNTLNLEPLSADPASPAQGDMQFSDGTVRAEGYWQYKAGAWTAFGGGASGINYMVDDNTDAENGIGDWVEYNDAVGVNPVNGVDQLTTQLVTFTQNSTTPLRGTADFKYIATAANNQGHGASCPFTVDLADKAQKLTISFDYDTSAANYADDDIRISVYDVTNDVLIRVNGEDLKAGKGTHYAQFQTASDSVSYRLIMHQSSTTALGFSVYFDNFKVGPTNIAKGSIISDTKSFTPTVNDLDVTPLSLTGTYSRVGDMAHVVIKMINNVTAGTGTSTNISFDFVEIGVIDTVKIPSYADNASVVGEASFDSEAEASIIVKDNTNVIIRDVGTNQGMRSADILANSQLTLKFTIPIQGWSSDTAMSSDLGGREIVVTGADNGLTSLTGGVTDIDFTETSDSTASWNGTVFTAPESGSYSFEGSISVASVNMITYLYKNTVQYTVAGFTGTAGTIHKFSSQITLVKGDAVSFRSHTAATLTSSSSAHWIHIQKLATPQTSLETETVAARYTSNDSGQVINTTSSIFIYEDIDYDTHNAYNIGTGIYTVPATGKYNVSAKFETGSLTLSTAQNVQLYIQVGGVTVKRSLRWGNGAAINHEADSSDTLDLVKGDEVKIFAYAGAATVANNSGERNTFSIARIK